eukprot:CAMPEP_0116561530 /NCGR_PEP_ID=MMETSP0397-20121206/11633_1 /TAXON_ID=216820 /ORGANISM="Cyclophora tenuis, Strain ECT3854" /LENGTH=67 /DNA_ID=CAMNT_0004087681 /DNA_START=74 /DNA_END=280 /DNA_ORIENTATION=-
MPVIVHNKYNKRSSNNSSNNNHKCNNNQQSKTHTKKKNARWVQENDDRIDRALSLKQTSFHGEKARS